MADITSFVDQHSALMMSPPAEAILHKTGSYMGMTTSQQESHECSCLGVSPQVPAAQRPSCNSPGASSSHRLSVCLLPPAGLDPLSAAKVLSATYTAIIPISPLPGHTLPRLLCRQLQQQQPALGGSTGSGTVAAPAFFGPPSPEADSPWLQLALYSCAAAGPVSLVFVAGCRWACPGAPNVQGSIKVES